MSSKSARKKISTVSEKQSPVSKLLEEFKTPPRQKIDDAIWDIVYERTERICDSFIYLVQDFHDTEQGLQERKEYNALIKHMVKRKARWMQR